MNASDPSSHIHQKEARFHDQWAGSTPLEDIRVREAFEAPTAMENRFILRRIGDLKGKKLLDVGAGLGESSVYFALQGAHVTCTDLSPGMVQAAENLARHHGVTIQGHVTAGESLNLPESSYDFVYVANTIHHVTDRRQLFEQMNKALKPGGWFYSWDPLAYNPLINVYRRLATEVRTEDESPLTFRDIALARQYFTQVGHREFWISSLALFLKYYAIDRVHPNADRYWKRIFKETERNLWWWRPLKATDSLLTRLPLIRRLAWNMVMWGQKP
jgi:SAM-dependent methyltransferase